MISSSPPPPWEPQACTLPTAERPLRQAEFDTLFTKLDAVHQLSATHARLHLSGTTGLHETVVELTARETDCCSFFTFTSIAIPTNDGERVTLDIEVPARQAAVLTALTQRAQSIAARDPGPR